MQIAIPFACFIFSAFEKSIFNRRNAFLDSGSITDVGFYVADAQKHLFLCLVFREEARRDTIGIIF